MHTARQPGCHREGMVLQHCHTHLQAVQAQLQCVDVCERLQQVGAQQARPADGGCVVQEAI